VDFSELVFVFTPNFRCFSAHLSALHGMFTIFDLVSAVPPFAFLQEVSELRIIYH
jgi:hypothetical protein